LALVAGLVAVAVGDEAFESDVETGEAMIYVQRPGHKLFVTDILSLGVLLTFDSHTSANSYFLWSWRWSVSHSTAVVSRN
jgi:hypothetical protein